MTQILEFEKYPFRIEPLPVDEGGGYFVTFPDLPGCMADGASYEEAIADARDAFRVWMKAQTEEGRPIPLPNGEGTPAKFVQRLPHSLHINLLRVSAAEGVSMNTLVTTYVAEGLARHEGRRAVSTLESGVQRILKNLEEVKFLATYDWNTTFVMNQVPGIQTKATIPYSQVGSVGQVAFSSVLNQPKAMVAR